MFSTAGGRPLEMGDISTCLVIISLILHEPITFGSQAKFIHLSWILIQQYSFFLLLHNKL